MNRTIIESARAMLIDAKLPSEYWGEAVQTAVYIHNRITCTATGDKTPFELWFSKKPTINSYFGYKIK